MKAIEEAQQLKSEIQARLAKDLWEFTERTGLIVSNVDVSAIEVTGLADMYPKVGGYSVRVAISV